MVVQSDYFHVILTPFGSWKQSLGSVSSFKVKGEYPHYTNPAD